MTKLRSLPVQIAFYFFAMCLLLIMLFGWVSSRQTAELILAKTTADTQATVKRSGAYVNGYIKRLKKIAAIMANDADVQQFAENRSQGQEALARLTTLLETDDYLLSGLVVTRDGRMFTNEVYFEMEMSHDMQREKWYQEAIRRQQMAVISSAKKPSRQGEQAEWVLSVSQEIVSAEGENLGVIRIDVAYEALAMYLKQMDLGQTGYSFILSNQGEIIYSQIEAAYSDQTVQAELRQIGQQGSRSLTSEQSLVTVHPLADSRWQLIAVTSLEELEVLAKGTREMLWLVGGLLLVIVFLGGLLVIWQLTKPLQRLEQEMAAFSFEAPKGDLKIGGSPEVQSLTQSFNLMTAQLVKVMADNREKEQLMRQFELQALASQINPHFLYNTLETIIWMAEFNDTSQVIETTQALAKFFRLSLNQGNQMIHLHEEIEQVRHYLFIQKQRYGQQLTYQITEDPRVAAYLMPKLILQPIVENALYHGIKESQRLGVIEVSSSLQQGRICLVVEDNGRGYQKEKNTTLPKLGGVGLENIKQRLKLQYGGDYDLIIDTELGQFTRVSLYLPLSSHSTSAN